MVGVLPRVFIPVIFLDDGRGGEGGKLVIDSMYQSRVQTYFQEPLLALLYKNEGLAGVVCLSYRWLCGCD